MAFPQRKLVLKKTKWLTLPTSLVSSGPVCMTALSFASLKPQKVVESDLKVGMH